MIAKLISIVYLDQIYMVASALLIVGAIVRNAGLEVLALFGFLTMLQGIIQIFDVGLSQLLQKKTAAHIENENKNFYEELKVAEVLYIAVGCVFFTLALISIILGINIIGNKDYHAINHYFEILIFIFMITGIRFYLSLYKGVLRGCGRHKEISIINIIVTTIKYVIPIPLLMTQKIDALQLFLLILTSALLELFLFRKEFNSQGIIEKSKMQINAKVVLIKIKGLVYESRHIATMSITWIILTNADKYILSKTSSPIVYGYYNITMNFVSVLIYVTVPIVTLLSANIVSIANGARENKIKNYKQSTELVCMLASLAAAYLIFNSDKIVDVWLGAVNKKYIIDLLWPYIIGNLFIIVTSISYTFMMAEDDLNDHVRYSICQLIGTLMIYPIAIKFEIKWVAIYWLCIQLAYFLFAFPKIAKKITGDNFYMYKILILLSVCFCWSFGASIIEFNVKNTFGKMLSLILVAAITFSPLILMLDKFGKVFKKSNQLIA